MDPIVRLGRVAESIRASGFVLAEEKKMVFGRWRDVANGGREASSPEERAAAASHHDTEAASHRKAAHASMRQAEEAGKDRWAAEKHASTAVEHFAHASAHEAEAARHRSGEKESVGPEAHREGAVSAYKTAHRRGYKAPFPKTHDAGTGAIRWDHPA